RREGAPLDRLVRVLELDPPRLALPARLLVEQLEQVHGRVGQHVAGAVAGRVRVVADRLPECVACLLGRGHVSASPSARYEWCGGCGGCSGPWRPCAGPPARSGGGGRRKRPTHRRPWRAGGRCSPSLPPRSLLEVRYQGLLYHVNWGKKCHAACAYTGVARPVSACGRGPLPAGPPQPEGSGEGRTGTHRARGRRPPGPGPFYKGP